MFFAVVVKIFTRLAPTVHAIKNRLKEVGSTLVEKRTPLIKCKQIKPTVTSKTRKTFTRVSRNY